MNAKFSILLGSLLLLCLTSLRTDSGIEFQNGELNTALTQSSEQGKIVFVDGYTTWCGPCKMMERQVFNQAELGTYFNEHFINVKSNLEKGDGPTVQKKYNIRAVPTLLFLDSNGKVLKRLVGFQSEDQLLRAAKSVVTKHGSKD